MVVVLVVKVGSNLGPGGNAGHGRRQVQRRGRSGRRKGRLALVGSSGHVAAISSAEGAHVTKESRQKVHRRVKDGHRSVEVCKDSQLGERVESLGIANGEDVTTVDMLLILSELDEELHPLDNGHGLALDIFLRIASARVHHARMSLAQKFHTMVRKLQRIKSAAVVARVVVIVAFGAVVIAMELRRLVHETSHRDGVHHAHGRIGGRKRRSNSGLGRVGFGDLATSVVAAELLSNKVDTTLARLASGLGNGLAQSHQHFFLVLATAMSGAKLLARERDQLFAAQLGGRGNGSATRGQFQHNGMLLDGLLLGHFFFLDLVFFLLEVHGLLVVVNVVVVLVLVLALMLVAKSVAGRGRGSAFARQTVRGGSLTQKVIVVVIGRLHFRVQSRGASL